MDRKERTNKLNVQDDSRKIVVVGQAASQSAIAGKLRESNTRGWEFYHQIFLLGNAKWIRWINRKLYMSGVIGLSFPCLRVIQRLSEITASCPVIKAEWQQCESPSSESSKYEHLVMGHALNLAAWRNPITNWKMLSPMTVKMLVGHGCQANHAKWFEGTRYSFRVLGRKYVYLDNVAWIYLLRLSRRSWHRGLLD